MSSCAFVTVGTWGYDNNTIPKNAMGVLATADDEFTSRKTEKRRKPCRRCAQTVIWDA
jgi:hypothetical protein